MGCGVDDGLEWRELHLGKGCGKDLEEASAMRYSKESEGEVSIADWRLVVMRRGVCLCSGETGVEGMSTYDTI